jgi:hypothetical protein
MGILVLLAALVGCGSDGVVAPERTWEEVRYHRNETQGGGSYGDLVIRSSGEIVYELQGIGASSRGLLAGENLETLARLIGALPPAGYSGQGTYEESFFLSVTEGGPVKSYHAGTDDPAMPSALQELVTYLQGLVSEFDNPKPEALDFRILAEGEQSGVASENRWLVRDRDGLLETLEVLGEHCPVLLPAVDFRRETVVAIFIGQRPSTGHGVTIDGAGIAEGGRIVLSESWIVPGEACPVEQRTSTPYVLAAIATSARTDLMVEIEVVTQRCGTVVSTDGS